MKSPMFTPGFTKATVRGKRQFPSATVMVCILSVVSAATFIFIITNYEAVTYWIANAFSSLIFFIISLLALILVLFILYIIAARKARLHHWRREKY